MKNCFIICTLMLLSFGCASTKEQNNNESTFDKTVKTNPGELSILHMIRRLPGVTVRGSGSNVSIRVFAGPSTINSSTDPLFLVNGIDHGSSYLTLESAINTDQVDHVEVYKTPSELARYGARGANGVINIILKETN